MTNIDLTNKEGQEKPSREMTFDEWKVFLSTAEGRAKRRAAWTASLENWPMKQLPSPIDKQFLAALDLLDEKDKQIDDLYHGRVPILPEQPLAWLDAPTGPCFCFVYDPDALEGYDEMWPTTIIRGSGGNLWMDNWDRVKDYPRYKYLPLTPPAPPEEE